jgi:hypothetical protein
MVDKQVSKALERATRGLQFADIFLATTDAWLAEDFDPKFDARAQNEGCSLQLKHQVIQSNIIEVKEADDYSCFFRVYIDVGVRMRYKDESESKDPVAQIEASYCLDYLITKPELRQDQEALDAYALHNASYHLWPYWREYLMSQALRMNLPKLPLPVRLFGGGQATSDNQTEKE